MLSLNKQTRNKQENIFEFMKTEVNYVKILTITKRVIHKFIYFESEVKFKTNHSIKVYVDVMLKNCNVEQKYIQQLFPDIEKLIDLHKSLLDNLMDRYKLSNNKFIETIGDILLEIVRTVELPIETIL